ncbi:MAG: hypothetical protein AAGG51_28200 [Cyanobacteria bacterium P01_G01_bin.54]
MNIATLILIVGIAFWSTLAFLAARGAMGDRRKPLRGWVNQLNQTIPGGVWWLVGIGYGVMVIAARSQIQIFNQAEFFDGRPMVIALFSAIVGSAALGCAVGR